MEYIIDCLYSIRNDEVPANQLGLPQYYRQQLFVLCDIIERLTNMKNTIQSNLEELENMS
jgi:hypothetical protein